MKMTMHIDEALLGRVVAEFGFESKTQAVDAALREMDRRARFKEVVAAGMRLAPAELRDAVVPDYDVLALRVAETGVKYEVRGKSKRSRR